MVFWIIVILGLLSLSATLFFVFDPAEKEWEKIDSLADRLSDAYWDLASHKGFEDPEVKELKVQREKATKARIDFRKTRKYRRIQDSEDIIVALTAITVILAVIILIIGIVLGFIHILAEATRAEILAEREVLQWEIDQNLYANDDDVIGHKELLNEVREWNKDLAYNKKCERDFWIGIFVPNIYSDIEPLVIK